MFWLETDALVYPGLGLGAQPPPGIPLRPGTAAQRAGAHGRPRPSPGRSPGVWRPLPQSAGAPTPALPRLPAVRGALGDVAAPRLVPQRPGAECTAGPPPTSGPRDARCAKAREASTRVRVPGSGHRARSGSQESAIVPGARLSSQRGASLTFWRRQRMAEGRGTSAAGNRRQRRWAGLRRRHERGAGPEPVTRSQSPRARRKWAGQEPGGAQHGL